MGAKWFSVGALGGYTRGWAGELSIKQPIVDQHDARDQVTTHIHTGPVAVGWHNFCFWFCVKQSAVANIVVF